MSLASVFIFILELLSALFCNIEACTLRERPRGLFASCNQRALTSVPSSLPVNIIGLELRHNEITFPSTSSLKRYSGLTYLDLSFNLLENQQTDFLVSSSHDDENGKAFGEPESVHGIKKTKDVGSQQLPDVIRQGSHPRLNTERNQTHQRGPGKLEQGHKSDQCSQEHLWGLSSLEELNLSHNNIQVLSGSMFTGLARLRRLNLSSNSLHEVGSRSFSCLSGLLSLDLSHNGLSRLHPAVFSGLRALTTLRLDNNSLSYHPSAIPRSVFKPVASSLTSLQLAHNAMTEEDQLPLGVGDLTSLEFLSVDALYNTVFGPEFQALRRLRSLELPNCHLTHLSNSTFLHLASTNLSTLHLKHCKCLESVEPCVLCPLKHLTAFSLRGCHRVGVRQALNTAVALVGRNVSLLDFHSVARGHWNGLKGSVLDPDAMQYVAQTCLASLVLSDNDMVAIRPRSLTREGSLLNACLRHFDISRNFLLDASNAEWMRFLLMTTSLETLHCQEQQVYSIREALDVYQFTYHLHSNAQPLDGVLTVYLAPSLRVVNFSASCKEIAPITTGFRVSRPNNLQVLDMSYVQITNCHIMIYGLTNLTSFNMSRSSCRALQVSFFSQFPSLRELSLQSVNLEHSFILENALKLLENLTHLERVDLSNNGLDFPLTDLFHAQRGLKELRVSGNRYKRLPLDLSGHSALTSLDLRNNAVTWLTEKDRDSLDSLAASAGSTVTLSLAGNPVACTCSTLEFVRWLSLTRVRFDQDGNYTCVTDDGSLSSTEAYMASLNLHWRRCVGARSFFGSLVALLLLLFALGGAWAVAVNASRLRLLFTVFRRLHIPTRTSFCKDAYLAYCDADTELACVQLNRVLGEQRGLRLLIKDLPRDIQGTQFWQLPGDNAAERMLEHIDLCWKVVLVLTQPMTRDPMAGFTTRAALQSISDTMPERVLLLCVGVRHVPALASLRALMGTVPERHVIFVPPGASDSHPAWDAVADIILH